MFFLVVEYINESPMQAQFKSLSLFDFQSRFPDDGSCLAYLADLKWSKGYSCRRCNNTTYCKGVPYTTALQLVCLMHPFAKR